MGRRVEKKVYTHDGSSWSVSDCRRFVYHNWLPLLEIGGLLACYDTNGTTTGADPTADDEEYIYFYDANGNVGQVIAWASGYESASAYAWHADRLVARYEYDAYGDIIGPDFDADGDWTDDAGPFAATNPFRFSTKYWDDETGLGYWGYRYYSPRLGRWISRDLIGE